jgi:uroporphyrin-III C-methyltransferase
VSARDVSPALPGRVSFVGAGPGAADLLTVRAIRVLARADVVLHDALMTGEVLDWAPAARCVPVGKRCDRASADQGWIGRTLVEEARRHASVVRLKGGDPTVFGRLDEEIDALDAAGIGWEIVPGITAASAAAAAAGHSLTRRGVARRLDVVTPRVGRDASGHDDEGAPGSHGEGGGHWADGLGPSGTVVLYMAGRIASACARTLVARGFPADTPAVAVRAASWPDEAVERRTLGALATSGLPVDDRPVVLLVGRAVADRRALAHARGRLSPDAFEAMSSSAPRTGRAAGAVPRLVPGSAPIPLPLG